MPDEQVFFIAGLVMKQMRGELTNEENIVLNEWLSMPGNRQLLHDLTNEKILAGKLAHLNDIDIETWRLKAYEQLFPGLVGMGERRKRNWQRYLVAASAIFLITAAAIWMTGLLKNKQPVQAESKDVINDIPPGTDKAVLMLADGSIINLDADDSSSLLEANGTLIRNGRGRLTYDARTAAGKEIYNLVSTKRGGKFSITLADGSKVWLNAASSLRFPVSFPGGRRIVEVTGEAYFEVAKDASRPFLVKAGQMEVAVTGTGFNIMAYEDEDLVKTTLIEGAVRVRNADADTEMLLAPGEQAQMNSQGEIVAARNVNIDEIVAWKNGFVISSNKEDLKVVMRQLSRWYDVDVRYEGNINVQDLRVKVPRDIKLSSLLHALEISSGLKFEVSHKTITVKSAD